MVGVLCCLLEVWPPLQTELWRRRQGSSAQTHGVLVAPSSAGTAGKGGVWHASGAGPLGRKSCTWTRCLPAEWCRGWCCIHAAPSAGVWEAGVVVLATSNRASVCHFRCVCAHTEVCPSFGALTLCELCCLLGCIGLCCCGVHVCFPLLLSPCQPPLSWQLQFPCSDPFVHLP